MAPLLAELTSLAPPPLFAQASSDTLPRSLLIAAVLMLPVALWQRQRIKARRINAKELATADPEDSGHLGESALEALIGEIGDIGTSLTPGQLTVVQVADAMTIDGNAADPGLVDTLVRDALARAGMDVIGTSLVDGTHRIECCKH